MAVLVDLNILPLSGVWASEFFPVFYTTAESNLVQIYIYVVGGESSGSVLGRGLLGA